MLKRDGSSLVAHFCGNLAGVMDIAGGGLITHKCREGDFRVSDGPGGRRDGHMTNLACLHGPQAAKIL